METERRTLARPIEVRAEDDGPRLVGYAAVFNEVTEIAGFFREQIAPDAFDEAVGRDDVRALFNHSPDLILGRTAAGTLKLSTDSAGLRYDVLINSSDPEAVGVLARVKRGDVDGSSFAFTVDEDEWEYPKGQLPLRTIRKVHLYDVSPVVFPAYAGTSVSARAEARAKELAAADLPPAQSAAVDQTRRCDVALAKRRRPFVGVQNMDLKAKRDALIAEAGALTEKAKAEGRAMTSDEQAAFDAKMTEIDQIAATLEREARIADLQRAMPPLPKTQEPAAAHVEVAERKREPGEWLGTVVRAQATFGANKFDAQKWAERTYGGSSPEFRALGWTDFTAGGALVPEEYSREIIPLLANAAVFRRAGARVLPLRGTLDIPEMTGGVTAYWMGENDDITPSEPTFGRRRLVEKTLAALTPVSNDLLRLGDPSVDLLIRDNIVQAFANAEDLAFFKGSGTDYQPKGIYYQMASAHNTATAGTALANFRTDIQDCVTYLDDDNIPRVRRAWFYPTSTVTYMKWTLVDGNSNFSFPELRANNTIDGHPVFVTNNLTTEMYHVEMSYVFIGDGPGLEIKVVDGAAWDNSGTVVAGFSRNQSVIRAIRKVDMIMANANAAACQNTLTV